MVDDYSVWLNLTAYLRLWDLDSKSNKKKISSERLLLIGHRPFSFMSSVGVSALR